MLRGLFTGIHEPDRSALRGFVLTIETRQFAPKKAPEVGLEPTTLRLTAECSTIELLRNNAAKLQPDEISKGV